MKFTNGQLHALASTIRELGTERLNTDTSLKLRRISRALAAAWGRYVADRNDMVSTYTDGKNDMTPDHKRYAEFKVPFAALNARETDDINVETLTLAELWRRDEKGEHVPLDLSAAEIDALAPILTDLPDAT